MRTVREGRLVHLAGTPKRGLLHWYPDPLPTNCVADWVCSGHRHLGKHNLAVFYGSCTLDCLFCQNWHFRETDPARDRQGTIKAMSAGELADSANLSTHCVCFFGGDPASQMPHALATGKKLAEQDIAVCWETAGTMHPRLLARAVKLSLESGGCIKFDLKAFDDHLHQALTGCSNARTLENFELAASHIPSRPTPPLVVASTLLLPGYVDTVEVGKIARFIANINPEIPYSLLGFHPNYMIHDLPRTSVSHAQSALDAAKNTGLTNVRIGNRHLLSREY
jgi:pyruvate formate lyase activating enzyme